MKFMSFLMLTVFITTGCATITQGTKEVLVVNSDPGGARVVLSTGDEGVTPAAFEVSKKRDILVTVSKDGYKTHAVQVFSITGGDGGRWVAGNIIFGGLIGLGVDSATGASRELSPNPVNVTLEAESESNN